MKFAAFISATLYSSAVAFAPTSSSHRAAAASILHSTVTDEVSATSNSVSNAGDRDILIRSATERTRQQFAITKWNLFMEGIVNYRNIYGDVLIPATFVVPRHDDNWPKACWDLPLGSIVQRLRLRNDFLLGDNAIQRKIQLDGLGFIWDVSEYKFLKLLRALRHFDRLQTKNNMSSREYTIRVPSKFVVPSGEDSGWPPNLWGYPLGAKCMAIRQKQLYVKNHPDRKQALEDIGFRWSGNATLGWLDVVHAAAIYSQMHGRVLNVPFNFVVPSPPAQDAESLNPLCVDSWPWPERLWGLRLGQRLKDVRLKGAYLKGAAYQQQVRRAQLDNLGFVWQPKRGRRKRCIVEDDVGETCTV